jgi:hypothetical protein
MRYELKRNKNGIITQCETNADGGNIYAQREEINKLALENLKRPTPGKLGDLSNMQIFNVLLNPGFTGSADSVFQQYNLLTTTGNVTDCVMFNVDSINNKASYYNIIDIKATTFRNVNNKVELLSDSYVEFYLLENIEGSNSSLGRKIPRRSPINGTSSGTVSWNSTASTQAYQSIKVDCVSDSVNIPSRLQGLRASGLALKQIDLNFGAGEDLTQIRFNFQIFVDITSVSNSY